MYLGGGGGSHDRMEEKKGLRLKGEERRVRSEECRYKGRRLNREAPRALTFPRWIQLGF